MRTAHMAVALHMTEPRQELGRVSAPDRAICAAFIRWPPRAEARNDFPIWHVDAAEGMHSGRRVL
jgi:hypothetical protein